MDSLSNLLQSLLNAQAGSVGLSQAMLAIAIAFIGGILTSFTPCVYPMIPITVGMVGGFSGGKRASWRELSIKGFCYVGGMTTVYSFLGVAAGLTGKVFGSFTNTPKWYFGLGLIIILSALWMMDVINFDPAAFIDQMKRKLSKSGSHSHTHHKKEVTPWSAFFLGATSGTIAAPCTTPVLTAILGFIAKTQSVGLGLSLMIAFSLGLSVLLLGILFFAGSAQVLPRSGNWMKNIKTASGGILLAFGIYLIYRAGLMGGI